jgi:hypothetical protein
MTDQRPTTSSLVAGLFPWLVIQVVAPLALEGLGASPAVRAAVSAVSILGLLTFAG